MRLSTGLVNKLADAGSLKDIMAGCVIDIYSSVQPALPDNAANGSLLVTVTQNAQPYTFEVPSAGTVTLSGTAGSVNTITVNGIDILGSQVAFTTDLATTAGLVAAQINRNPKNLLFVASAAGAVVTIAGSNGLGALPNGWAVAGTLSTMTATYAAMAGGVDCANGLHFDAAVNGVISKVASETWSGVIAVGGTAGWYRMRQGNDTGAGASTTAVRSDGTIGTSGADMILGSLGMVAGAPFLLPSGALTIPQQ